MEDHRSYWQATSTQDTYPALAQSLEADVLVIGGGITGVSCAHALARAGHKVVLAERYQLGAGETLHTTAHLTYMTDTRLSDLVSVCGREAALHAWQAGCRAMEQISRLATELGEDVGLERVPGYLAASWDDGEREWKSLREEAQLAASMGFACAYLERVPPTGRPGIRFDDQLKFHPGRYLRALAKDCVRLGVRIFEQTEVSGFQTDPSCAIANGCRIGFGKLVIATHVPLQGLRGTMDATLFQTKIASYSTYALAARVAHGLLEPMIWSDTAEPFNYLRVERDDDHDIVIFGGQDHKTGQAIHTHVCYDKLELDLRRIVSSAEITQQWSGQVIETIDGLPYIGEAAEGQFIATGFSGNGMTFGVVSAMMARDWAAGAENAWASSFSPDRKLLAALPTYVVENKDFPYHLIKDRIGIPAAESCNLSPGEGRVIKKNGSTLAVCMDSHSHVHELSAVCPHMGCIVAWNDAEQTWDCPCHGSRFSAEGSVIAGPAEKGLDPLVSK